MAFWKSILLNYLSRKSLKDFWQTLMNSWPQSTSTDKEKIFLFLYNAGLWRNFITLFLHELSMEQPQLPWAHLFAILERTGEFIPSDQRDTIHAILAAQNIDIPPPKSYQTVLGALLKKQRYRFLNKVQARKDELLSSVRIAKSERLHDQQIQYLRELRKMFPEDHGIQQNLHHQQLSDAEMILSKQRLVRPQKTAEKQQEEAENESWVLHLVDQARHQAQTNENRVDIAYMLRQMGFPRLGLEFLTESVETPRSQWLLFDFLFSSQQYVSLLHHCERMKTTATHEPESQFSISYYQALALWELGEKQSAISLMRQIASMKPNYRSANELLSRWVEDVA